MKFVRRTEGVMAARPIFKRAREDPRCSYHIYVAAALMEYYCSKVRVIFIPYNVVHLLNTNELFTTHKLV
jgi:hypothetical protein